MRLIALALAIAICCAASASASTLALKASPALGDEEWKGCVNIPVLNDVCLVLIAENANMTLIGEITVDNHTVAKETIHGNQLCIDDDVLLELVSDMCAECKPIIDEIKRILGHVPADVLNVCVELEDVDWTKDSVSGIAELVYNILCWKDKCVAKGDKDMGHFDIHF